MRHITISYKQKKLAPSPPPIETCSGLKPNANNSFHNTKHCIKGGGETSTHLAMVFMFAKMTGKGSFCHVSQQVSSDVVGQLKEHWTPEEGVTGKGLSFLTQRGIW